MPRVLVIDDDEITLTLLQNVLQDEGCEVFSTADGPQGITIFKRMEPDLVLLDLGLPSMNGLEVLRKIKAIDQDARIIIVTGYGTEEAAEVARKYGAFDFVQKPANYEDFLTRIRAALNT
jgi:DNA-binding response OmpR family regulator